MSNLDTCYQLFSLKPGASKQDLKQAYKRLAKQWHPDRFANDPTNARIAEERIKAINVAYEILQNHQEGAVGYTSCAQTSTTVRTRKVTPQESFDKAKFFAKRGQYTEAAEELGKAVKLDVKFSEAYYFRSLIFSEIGFDHRSASDLRRARELGFNAVNLDPEVVGIFGVKSCPARTGPSASREKPKTEQKPPGVKKPGYSATIHPESVFAEISEPICAVAISPNQRFLALGKNNGDIDLWNYKARKQFSCLKGHKAEITNLIFSDDNQFLFSSSLDGTVNLWSLNNGSLVKSMLICDRGVTAFDLCYSRKFIITADAAGFIQTWDFQKNKKIKQIVRKKAVTFSVFLNSTGDGAVFGAEDGSVNLCYVSRDGSVMNLRGHNEPVKALAFSPGKQIFASGSLSGEICLWKYPNRQPKIIFESFHQSINALVFCYSGQVLCGMDKNGRLIIWDVGSGAVLHKTMAHAAGNSKLISLSNEAILSTHSDGTVKIWKIHLSV
ncbi:MULTISPECIES: DnaJ domain-containing protein [Cyanophyceae]|uniref:DnaJ domain-containing protein n=1 Tax=Cyanophyceae TaxID=3028117 RepID=UPI0016846517|nr:MULTISPECIES: DnaJ domain-containing protein [Cyanophyceae]MBD1918729.1 DnaJ domain-containing protein [Phormidium sp. FACHB-77]MBD2029064.1 DnaJ domain-containing protein [Phormidium sp. FACHB-322]MBD2051348.1 DnaJ domain-containing protein [Leptolyngbya sp. FACHB-60]